MKMGTSLSYNYIKLGVAFNLFLLLNACINPFQNIHKFTEANSVME
jgi:hypothetical protein